MTRERYDELLLELKEARGFASRARDTASHARNHVARAFPFSGRLALITATRTEGDLGLLVVVLDKRIEVLKRDHPEFSEA